MRFLVPLLVVLVVGCAEPTREGFYEGDLSWTRFDFRVINDSGQIVQFELMADGREVCRAELKDLRSTPEGACVPSYLKGKLYGPHDLSIHVRFEDERERSDDFTTANPRAVLIVRHFQTDLKESCFEDPRVAHPTCPPE